MIAAIFHGWTAVVNVLLLVALLALTLSLRQKFLLAKHRRIIEGQGHTPGGLTDIISLHLPPSLRTNIASDELPLLKTAIERKDRR